MGATALGGGGTLDYETARQHKSRPAGGIQVGRKFIEVTQNTPTTVRQTELTMNVSAHASPRFIFPRRDVNRAETEVFDPSSNPLALPVPCQQASVAATPPQATVLPHHPVAELIVCLTS